MQNDKGQNVDLYIPRKWCVTRRAARRRPRGAGAWRRGKDATHALTYTRLSLLLSPFRSSWTKRLITSDDYAAVQINIGDVDPATGKYTGSFKTFALCGYIRDKVREKEAALCAGGKTLAPAALRASPASTRSSCWFPGC